MAGDGRKCAGFRVPKMIAGESFLRPKERIGRQPLVAEHEGLDGRRSGDPPSSEEIGDRRSFSAKGQAGTLSLNPDSCAPGVVAVCKVKQQRASGRQQETYLLCSVRHEYSASSSGELRCPQRQSLQLKKTACEASIQKLVSSMGTLQSPHGTSSLPGGQAHKIREVRPPVKATRTLKKMFVAAWTGKKADRAAQTAPSAALAAAEHHAGAGALGVGTQRFLAAGDIGNSSARPPGNAQKKQLKDTPK